MSNVVVSHMIGRVDIFEFNKMFNKGEQIFSISTKRSFFDARVFNDMLLVYEIQYYCKDSGIRNELDAVLDIIQNKLQKDIILIRMRKDEEMCQNVYHYVFLLK